MRACSLTAPTYLSAHQLRDDVVQAAFHKGLLLLGCGESAIRFCPPLCVTAEQVGKALGILEVVLEERPAPVVIA